MPALDCLGIGKHGRFIGYYLDVLDHLVVGLRGDRFHESDDRILRNRVEGGLDIDLGEV